MGLRLRKYIELTVRLHIARSLRATIALFLFVLIKLGIIIFGHAHLHSRT